MSSLLIIAAFAGCGVWLLYMTRGLIRLGLSSYKWGVVEGTIVDSFDDSFDTPGVNNTMTGVVPVVNKEVAHVFEYVVDGRAYRSNTYCFGCHLDKADAAYLIGTKVPVYYNPKHPEVAVLKRGVQFGTVIGLFPIGIAIVLAFLVFRSR
jgi:hypothetical protein